MAHFYTLSHSINIKMDQNQKPYQLRQSTMSNKISYREVTDKEIFAQKRRTYTHTVNFIKKADLVAKLADATNKAQSLTLELTDANKKANDLQITISTLHQELQTLKDLKEVANEKINLLNTQLIKLVV